MITDPYPEPAPASTPPTWEDLERLALHYAIVYHAVTRVRRGELEHEAALLGLVFVLIGEWRRFMLEEIERRRNGGPPVLCAGCAAKIERRS